MTQPAASPVEYPTIVAGGKVYTLKFAHSAWFQLQQWGYQIGDPNRPIPIVALAAAAAGEIGPDGRWKSARFASAFDLTDSMIDGETLDSFAAPVLEALGKAAPKATLTLTTPTAEAEPVN